MRDYYDARAAEYDEWYAGTGLFASRDRPGWHDEVEALTDTIARLTPRRTLDVACGTGFLTRHLPGEVTALDQSEQMLRLAAERVPGGEIVRGDALALPFADGAFERVFTGHFYGHLEDPDRVSFIAQARRVADEIVVVDSALRPDHGRVEWQRRALNDGSRFEVFKRYFDAATLLDELGGGDVLHEGAWFVMVSSAG